MSIKSVVKVMNFHSLLRVDKSRSKAKKFTAMEEVLTDMIDNILNNRNIVLDFATLRVKEDKPVLNIYMGSDMGFCSNLNSLVNHVMDAEEENAKQIIIGRKIKAGEHSRLLLHQTREEYEQDNTGVMDIIESGIRQLAYSKVTIIYNHYYNSSLVELEQKQIFPLEKKNEKESGERCYKEDFSYEGNINELLENLVVLYMKYSIEIAAAASYAAENISRQNVTTESMHKIADREEEFAMQERKVKSGKQFAKVLDNYTKLKQY